jgi:diguanylate cyclase (GGDEF)-like protein/PAS domain S-box-containing protein
LKKDWKIIDEMGIIPIKYEYNEWSVPVMRDEETNRKEERLSTSKKPGAGSKKSLAGGVIWQEGPSDEKSSFGICGYLEEGIVLHEIILDENARPRDYRILQANQAFCGLFSLEREHVIGRSLLDFLPDCPNALREIYDRVAVGGKPLALTRYFSQLDRHLKIRAYAPAAGRLIAVVSDMTEMVRKNQELEREKERLLMAVDAADLALLDIQMSRNFVHAQGGIFSGLKIETVADLDAFFSCIHPEDGQGIGKLRQGLLAGQVEALHYEFRFTHEDRERWIEMNLKVTEKTPEGRADRIIGVIRDIDQKKRESQKIEYLASHDLLTRTLNRNAFEGDLRQSIPEEAFPVGLMLFDVDGLKLLNDGFGHEKGDLLLTKFADTLRSECHAPARIYRIGGDEFAVIVPQADADKIRRMQRRIRRAVDTYNLPIRAGVSGGFGCVKSSFELLEDVFLEAEDQMYRNKLWEKKRERDSMSDTLIKSLQARTQEDYAHLSRMEGMALKMAEALDLDEHVKLILRKLAYAHDIGKLSTPREILYKPDALNEEEWAAMRRHSEVGYRIALGLNDLALAASSILQHHERWDGSGYPQGMQGEEIPLPARVIAIIDAYDAITHDRCYRKAKSEREAMAEIRRCAGTQFDPTLVGVFEKMMITGG